ncbi:MAG TPA: hypothetical protein VHU83_22825 [Bryobacteraceae bacterium]|jgi:hypothetical protein|nr:hypothetical protein [Bryobacteraceae bacterium]
MAELSHASRLGAASVWARARPFLTSQSATVLSLALLFLCGWLAFTWFETIQRMLRYYTPLPTWDYWRTAAFVRSYQAFDARILWRQHNEHRIVFPEIVFAADYLLLHGRQVLPLAISFLCYLGSWLVLAWTFARHASVPKPVGAIGILLAGIIIGWQGSAVVLADTFLLQWTLLQFAALLSLALLARSKETAAHVDVAAAIVCAVIATYSSANGLTLWPVLIGAALWLRIAKRHLLALIVAAVASIGVYFIGYHFAGHLSLARLLSHPWYLLEFIGAYLSMPFGEIKTTEFGVSVGLISLALTLVFAAAAAKHRLLASRVGIVLFGWYLFMLLTILLTVAGRMNLNDPTFSAAKANRYLTGPLVTWAVFILLALWLSARLSWRFARPYAIAFVIALLMLAGLPKLRWWLHGADQERAKAQLEALAIELGIQDPNVELAVFLDPPAVPFWSKDLRDQNLSVFYHPRSKWLGKAVSSFGRLQESLMPGEITYTFPVLDGVEVAGWTDESRLRGSRGWILLADESGRIVGFGRKLPAGFPGAFENPRTPPALGWAGFVNLNYPTKSFSAYVIDKGGLFPIQGSAGVPNVQVSTLEQAGPQIQGIQWRMDPAWTINRLPPNPFWGPEPPPPFYSSWSRVDADANTGRITSSIFDAPANGCVIFPVLQGPRSSRLSADVVDADTGRTVASVPLQDTNHQWVFWRLPLPASAKRLRIVAEDKGKGWGEWLAIGSPSQCK